MRVRLYWHVLHCDHLCGALHEEHGLYPGRAAAEDEDTVAGGRERVEAGEDIGAVLGAEEGLKNRNYFEIC